MSINVNDPEFIKWADAQRIQEVKEYANEQPETPQQGRMLRMIKEGQERRKRRGPDVGKGYLIDTKA